MLTARTPLRLAGALPAALLAVAALTGCENSLQTQNTSLAQENQELRAALDANQAALDAAEAERLRAQDELAAKAAADAAPNARNPFSDIPNVEAFASGPGEITVRVPGDVLFDAGKVTLKGSAQKTLDQVASVIRREYPGQTLRIEGYTDTDPIRKSGWKDNLQLSAERAMAVERYLASRGLSDDAMYSAGFGEARPLESKAKSRRVEIVVVK